MTLGLFGAEIRVVAIDRDREPLEALAASASEQSRAADPITHPNRSNGRLRGRRDHKSLLRARFGRIGLLVKNAGIGPGSDQDAA
jgi:NADP-dependent 3-hydroxy acid dehydrogenase YdfG